MAQEWATGPKKQIPLSATRRPKNGRKKKPGCSVRNGSVCGQLYVGAKASTPKAKSETLSALMARLKPCPDEQRQAEARRYVTAKSRFQSQARAADQDCLIRMELSGRKEHREYMGKVSRDRRLGVLLKRG